MDNFLPYGTQWIDEVDVEAVSKVLQSGFLTQGPEIERFENEIKKLTGAKYCVTVSNGTQALHIAVAALELPEGREGITTPITFVASANCMPSNRLVPIFADIDPKTYNISPEEIEKKITQKTKLIIPVDYAGQPVNINEIKRIADKHNLYIIEDAAHAIGSNYKDGKPVGCCHKSDITIFSFHPCKTITCGEGGALTTNSKDLYEKLIKLRTIGITKKSEMLRKNPGPWYYEMHHLSGNNRMTDFQAALGTSQIQKLSSFKTRRREIVKKYNNFFNNCKNLVVPYEDATVDSCFHLYVLQFDFEAIGKTRSQVMHELEERKIGTQVHYIPVNSQPYYVENYGYTPEAFPEAEKFYDHCLSIPLFPKMTDEDVDYVIECIRDVIDD